MGLNKNAAIALYLLKIWSLQKRARLNGASRNIRLPYFAHYWKHSNFLVKNETSIQFLWTVKKERGKIIAFERLTAPINKHMIFALLLVHQRFLISFFHEILKLKENLIVLKERWLSISGVKKLSLKICRKTSSLNF